MSWYWDGFLRFLIPFENPTITQVFCHEKRRLMDYPRKLNGWRLSNGGTFTCQPVFYFAQKKGVVWPTRIGHNRAINRYKYQTLLGCIADIWPALWWVCERVVASHRKMTINHWEVDILNSETNPNLFINEPFPATIGWFYMCLHCSPATISFLSQAAAISRDIVPTMDVSLKTKNRYNIWLYSDLVPNIKTRSVVHRICTICTMLLQCDMKPYSKCIVAPAMND